MRNKQKASFKTKSKPEKQYLYKRLIPEAKEKAQSGLFIQCGRAYEKKKEIGSAL